MTLDKRAREQMLALCGEIHEDDGIDPRQFFKSRQPRKKPDRKTRQLCRQVAETLTLVLSGECCDELLQSLCVLAVEPAPDSSRLMVTVRGDWLDQDIAPRRILKRLSEETGRLRCEVARAITRKRVPQLTFQVVGLTEVEEVGL